MLSCIAELDKRKKPVFHGNQHKSGVAPYEAAPNVGKSAEATAETLGISRSKVERARTVIDKSRVDIQTIRYLGRKFRRGEELGF